ncbi:hypothetical protein [uncultured Polaribacter sp.]|uniref:hypothetical protein n=1 Tax=uncultured Polaribacter sp. TaxID=174711 RepID=UPI0026069912|nr:hypothetical protein [uncultured Polaribacter sp.]
MKKIIIFSVLLFATLHLKAQEKTFWNKLKGEELETSVTILPFGTHYTALQFNEVYYVGFNYKSFELARFTNSFGEPSLTALYKRKIAFTENFSMQYGFGFMYGYHGKLQDVETIPFRNSFLFTGQINPLGGINLDYKLAKKLSFNLAITPVVAIYGLRYIL